MSPGAQRYQQIVREYPHLPLSDRIAIAQAACQGRSIFELRIIVHALMGCPSRIEAP